jgi:TonB family protein
MPAIVRFGVMTSVFALAITGCAAPPSADVDAAKAAVDKAVSERAAQYAGESLKAAQEAQAALAAELKAQDGKLIKSYDRARELAAAAKAAGDKAVAEAVAGREKAEAVAARAKAAAASRAKAKAEAVKVGGAIKAPTKVKHVDPIYPPIAKTARVSGTVVLEATVGPDGKVIDTRVVKSVPLLDQAALDAVQQWEYTPSVQKGVAIPVVMTITINFTPK